MQENPLIGLAEAQGVTHFLAGTILEIPHGDDEALVRRQGVDCRADPNLRLLGQESSLRGELRVVERGPGISKTFRSLAAKPAVGDVRLAGGLLVRADEFPRCRRVVEIRA